MLARTFVSCLVMVATICIGVFEPPAALARGDEGRSTATVQGLAPPDGEVPAQAPVVARPDGGSAINTSRPRGARAARQPRRDSKLGLASAVFHPRVARAARQLDGARDLKEAADAARELLRIDSEAARDVVADYAARSPLRAFDHEHRVLLIIDGSTGRVHQALAAEPTMPKPMFNAPPGMSPHEARKLERMMSRDVSQIKLTSMTLGDPPILWSAVRRLPDGAVAADEGGGGDSVSFILKARDQPTYYRITFGFQGARIDWKSSMVDDVTDTQLRRWKASAWWPKDWR